MLTPGFHNIVIVLTIDKFNGVKNKTLKRDEVLEIASAFVFQINILAGHLVDFCLSNDSGIEDGGVNVGQAPEGVKTENGGDNY